MPPIPQTTESHTSNPAYIAQLTFLRFLAAVWVVIFHYGQHSQPFDTGWIGKLMAEGSTAVTFFFFLSGMVLTLNYRDQRVSLKNFFLKRMARIYPVYLLAFLITLLLTISLYHALPKGLSIILQGLGFHAWLPGICLEINFPSWSVSVEVFFYLLFPFLLRAAKKAGLWKVSLSVILLWAASTYLHHYLKAYPFDHSQPWPEQFILYFPPFHLNAFCFGIWAGLCVLRLKAPTARHTFLFRLAYVAGIALVCLILTTENPIRPLAHNGVLSPLYFMITVGLALDRSVFTRILAARPLVFLGNISYAIYIIQFPVYIVYTESVGVEDTSGLHFYAYLAALIAMSGIVYRFFEKKMRFLIIKKTVKPSPVPHKRTIF